MRHLAGSCTCPPFALPHFSNIFSHVPRILESYIHTVYVGYELSPSSSNKLAALLTLRCFSFALVLLLSIISSWHGSSATSLCSELSAVWFCFKLKHHVRRLNGKFTASLPFSLFERSGSDAHNFQLVPSCFLACSPPSDSHQFCAPRNH